jgi:superfamily I DNA and/or RNA helicase
MDLMPSPTTDAKATTYHNAFSLAASMLTRQYRMHPDISAFPSAEFYGGRLVNDDSVALDRALDLRQLTAALRAVRAF